MTRHLTDSDPEAQRAAARDIYRAIFEHLGMAAVLLGADTIIRLANRAFERMLGIPRAEIEGRRAWTEFVHPLDVDRMREYHELRRRDPASAPGEYEFRLKTGSGEFRDMHVSVTTLPATGDRIATFLDITDRKRAEQMLGESEDQYRTIFENTATANIIAAEDTTILLANSNFERLTGYSRQELEGRMSWTGFIVPEDLERMKHYHFRRRLEPGGAPRTYEFSAIMRSGERRNLFMTVSMIPGSPLSIASIIDMTERRRAEEGLRRAQKMEAIGTLAGGIAHDFNNLMTGILGNVSLMLMEAGPSHPFRERLLDIEQYVTLGSSLTTQLLGFARGGSYEVKPTDLAGFGRSSAEMFGRTRKDIAIHVSAPAALWPVEVDRGQMEQVLLNLFMNAGQAMPGGGDLYLTLENDAIDHERAAELGLPPGRFVRVAVRDTGFGMDEETRSRIFEPFFTTKDRTRGTGLGLASVYGIVRHHDGCIQVDSAPGAGTTFTIYLPATDKIVSPEPGVPAARLAGQGTVLLVDDEPMILKVGARMLERLGYKVLQAAGGREGLELHARHRDEIDLVILDMIMPDMGGRQTFEALLRQDPNVRVLLSSGYSIDGQAKEILAAGCKGFIQKPFNLATLSRRLRELLDART